jgi:hypothetical protein
VNGKQMGACVTGLILRLKAYIRVVTLDDGETVHNVFKDGDFVE